MAIQHLTCLHTMKPLKDAIDNSKNGSRKKCLNQVYRDMQLVKAKSKKIVNQSTTKEEDDLGKNKVRRIN